MGAFEATAFYAGGFCTAQGWIFAPVTYGSFTTTEASYPPFTSAQANEPDGLTLTPKTFSGLTFAPDTLPSAWTLE